jgi:LysM repeat protein
MGKEQQVVPAQASAPDTAGPAASSGAGGASNSVAQDALKKSGGGGVYVVQKGDTLWGIAHRTYGIGTRWKAIYKANPDKVKQGGDLIYVGTILTLPKLDDAGQVADDGAAGGGQAKAAEPESRTTDFGDFVIYPNDFVGPLPPNGDVQHVVLSTFQKLQADAMADELANPEIMLMEGGMCFDKPQVVTVGGEKVSVSSKSEALLAARYIREIRNDYGIKVDSQAGVDALKKDYTSVPKTELDKLKTKEWEFKELAALHRALSHFAAILGDSRKTSSRSAATQEVGSVSKVDQAVDENTASGTLDTTTLGEYFGDSKNFSMFSAGTDSTVDFADNDKQLEGTAIHEIAHGLMKHEVGGYATALKYWTDKNTKSGDASAEAPVTAYAQTNASEDLSEAVMYYFVDRATLKSKCPIRDAYIDKIVQSWTPKKAP